MCQKLEQKEFNESCNVSRQLSIDWVQTQRNGLLEVYVAKVQAGLGLG